MARFKVTPFVDYKASRYGVRIAGKEFEFLPTCAVISTRLRAGRVRYVLARKGDLQLTVLRRHKSRGHRP